MLPIATSVDGRRFTFQAPPDPLELRVGGYVVLERTAGSGRCTALELASVDAGELGWSRRATCSPRRR